MNRRRRIGALLATTVLCATSACGGSDDTVALAVPRVYDLTHDPAADIAVPDSARTDVLPANQLRLTVERLFGWHGITLVQAMQAAERGDAGGDAWIQALASNTDDITGAIGLVYGPDGARAFYQQWAQHTQFLIDYADAVRRHDSGDQQTARDALDDYAHDAGSLLSTATGGAVPVDVATDLLTNHVAHMMEQVDLLAAGDREGAARVALDDNTYLIDIAGALSGAFAAQQPDAFPGATDDPHTLLCSLAGRSSDDVLLLHLLGSETAAITGPAGELDDALGAGTSTDPALADVDAATTAGDEAAAVAASLQWRTLIERRVAALPS